MIKYENSTLKNIYPKYITDCTDIDPTVDFVFPVNKIVKKKFLKTNLKLTKCVFRSCNFWKLSKELNMFLLLRITVMSTSCLSFQSLQLLLPVIQTIFFRCRDFQSAEKKIQQKLKIKCLLFRPKQQKFHTAEITGYTVYIYISLKIFLHSVQYDKTIFSIIITFQAN
jgi:hypothetical protein